jgi:hypothetical protein
MIRSLKVLLITLVVIFLILLAWLCVSLYVIKQTEGPRFTLFRQEKTLEIRNYAPFLIAEIPVKGSFTEAIQEGSHSLAEYLFGKNSEQKRIAISVPVRETILGENGDMHLISFILPSNLTSSTAPKPLTRDIRIQTVQATRMAVLRFSGYPSEAKVLQHTRRLYQLLQANENHTALERDLCSIQSTVYDSISNEKRGAGGDIDNFKITE